jgi:hypothetical protein
VERSGQAIGVEASKGQRETGGARGFDEGRQLFIDGTSRMNREVQVRICEGLGVKLPGPTRHREMNKPQFSSQRGGEPPRQLNAAELFGVSITSGV